MGFSLVFGVCIYFYSCLFFNFIFFTYASCAQYYDTYFSVERVKWTMFTGDNDRNYTGDQLSHSNVSDVT